MAWSAEITEASLTGHPSAQPGGIVNPTINSVFPAITCFADRFGRLAELSDALLQREAAPYLGLPPSLDRVVSDIADQAGTHLEPAISGLKDRMAWLLPSGEPQSSPHHLYEFVQLYKRYPFHAAYYCTGVEEEQHMPFPARAFAILHKIAGSRLLFHVLVDEMSLMARSDVRETWTHEALQALGVMQRPEENTLLVWRAGARWLEASPTPPGTAVAMHLDNFHDRARLELSLRLQRTWRSRPPAPSQLRISLPLLPPPSVVPCVSMLTCSPALPSRSADELGNGLVSTLPAKVVLPRQSRLPKFL